MGKQLQMIWFDKFSYTQCFHGILLTHTYASVQGTCLYISWHIICTRFSLYEYMMILSEPTGKEQASALQTINQIYRISSVFSLCNERCTYTFI